VTQYACVNFEPVANSCCIQLACIDSAIDKSVAVNGCGSNLGAVDSGGKFCVSYCTINNCAGINRRVGKFTGANTVCSEFTSCNAVALDLCARNFGVADA